MVFPKEFFENLNFEKISRQQKKTCKITQHVNSKDQPRHVPSVYEKKTYWLHIKYTEKTGLFPSKPESALGTVNFDCCS